MKATPTVHVALPAMNEREYLPDTIQCLEKQTYKKLKIWVCVNQPARWWHDPDKKSICENNSETLAWLTSLNLPNLHIIDKSGPGKGWAGKDQGVGQARKTLMDEIAQNAEPSDIITSLDSDTRFGAEYIASVSRVFENQPKALALSNPYFHPLTGNETLDRAMLRYEIYMRYYALNMVRIGSPYSFTALGSAISLPVKSYRKIGGITAKKSGEDFYLLQKIRKTGPIALHNTETVFPATRYSDRVFFGTGPALIKGSQGNWSSYPIYDHRLFDQVQITYSLFPSLYFQDLETPMSAFLHSQFAEKDIFGPLRKNFKSKLKFIEACHHKIDGLRVLQFLKHRQSQLNYSDEDNFMQFFDVHFPDFFDIFDRTALNGFNFHSTSIELLNRMRVYLFEKEKMHQMCFRV